jgi:hypothetical protein
MVNIASHGVQDGERLSIRLEVLVDCVLFARDGFGIAAVAHLVVSVYYLCHHVLPRRHPRVISLRDAPADETLIRNEHANSNLEVTAADRASRRTVARRRWAENLSVNDDQVLSEPAQPSPRILHALDANGQVRRPVGGSW